MQPKYQIVATDDGIILSGPTLENIAKQAPNHDKESRCLAKDTLGLIDRAASMLRDTQRFLKALDAKLAVELAYGNVDNAKRIYRILVDACTSICFARNKLLDEIRWQKLNISQTR
jgi:hypothetical protein